MSTFFRLSIVLFGIAIIVPVKTLAISGKNETDLQFNDGDFHKNLEEIVIERRKLFNRNTERRCRFRDWPLYPTDWWIYLTGGACFGFTNPQRFTYPNLKLSYDFWTRNNQTLRIPFVYHPLDGTRLFFDYRDQESVNTYVSILFNSRISLNQWLHCSEDADNCCNNILDDNNIMPSENYPCPALWDGWSCIPQAQAEETVSLYCPSFIYTEVENMCLMKEAKKDCFANGTWNHTTNYNGCSAVPILTRRHEFHVLVLIISTILSFPAVVILLSFRKLRSLRLVLLNSLLIAIIIKNILTILSKEAIHLQQLRHNDIETVNMTVLNRNPVGCRILSYFENVSENVIFTLMLINAYYLHKSLVRVFSTDPKMYVMYTILAVCSLTPSTIWAVLMGVSENVGCWVLPGDTWYSWISDGYRYFVLLLNLLLLVDILRLLLFSTMKNNARQTRSAFKGAVFLVPLFGIHILLASFLTAFNAGTCLAEDFFIYFVYLIEASQGILVALLFCYLSYEVHKEIRNCYRKLSLLLESRYGTIFTGIARRSTDSTNAWSSADKTRTSIVHRDNQTERNDGDSPYAPHEI